MIKLISADLTLIFFKHLEVDKNNIHYLDIHFIIKKNNTHTI